MAPQASTGIPPSEISYQLSHALDNRKSQIVAVNIFVLVLSVIAVVLRFLARRINAAKISWDDVMIVIALALSTSLVAIALEGAHLGLGKHAVLAGLIKLREMLKLMLAFELLYSLAIFTSKFAILLLYLRIFSNVRRFKHAVYVVMVYVVIWLLVAWAVILAQCRPVRYFWDRVDPAQEGVCKNYAGVLLALAFTNILSDIMILLLPFPVVWQLHVSTSNKLLISVLFLLGGFVTMASGFRLRYVHTLNAGYDPTWDVVDVAIWSTVEACIAVVCANLAIMRPIFVRYIQEPLVKFRRSDDTFGTPLVISSPMSRPTPQQAIPSTDVSNGSTLAYSKQSVSDNSEVNKIPSESFIEVTHPATEAPKRSHRWHSFIPHKDSRLRFSTLASSAAESHVDPEMTMDGAPEENVSGIRVKSDLEWSTEENRAAENCHRF